ncbi:CBS domain-containing protein [Natrononativus amylolyticus]|uniref:CBS domain-containing protein n=1 Tax=Natrononativus amylolyticus TaxID=2963434 RepID=UPI0020CC5A63|nr:CBS domain-containing protein [Natrononativus amylolyticus]
MTVDTLSRSDVVTATVESSVRDLAVTMRDDGVGSVVITDGDEPVGIVTDRDLTVAVLAEGADADELDATDVMSDELRTIDHDAGFYEATELMNSHGIRRLPVVGADGELAGIITADDLSELLADEHQELTGVLRSQRAPY